MAAKQGSPRFSKASSGGLNRKYSPTESLRWNYSASGIVQFLRTAYSQRSKYVPSDTHPPRQVPVARKGRIGTCLSPSLEARLGWQARPTILFVSGLHSRRLYMAANSLQELYVEQLQDLYNAE